METKIIFLIIIAIIICIFIFSNKDKRIHIKYPKKYPYEYKTGNATAVLTRGYTTFGKYKDLISRNKSIALQPWSKEYDHLIFHEGNITPVQINFIKQRSGDIDLKFVSVKPLFEDFKERNGYVCKDCPPTLLSEKFPYGYKAMCYFWFVEFTKYCYMYNNIFRVDEDCTLNGIQSNPAIPTVIASPMYQGMDCFLVIKGMNEFFEKLSKTNKYNWKWDKPHKWRSPYTNVMWISLQWAMSPEVTEIRNKVSANGCIISNRWGDLPLWGATCKLIGVPECNIDTGYYHGSHGKTIN
jgi:hypothetical protein